MNENNDVVLFSFENDNEKLLKMKLNNLVKRYGDIKTYSFLAVNNRLLLNSCNISENDFIHILFRNYIYFLNESKQDGLNYSQLPKGYLEAIYSFNNFICNNNFEEAFNIFSNCNIIYQMLCTRYLRDMNKEENNRVSSDKRQEVYDKLSLLENTSLSVKKEKVKVYQKISTK